MSVRAAGPSPAGLGAGLRLGVKGATQLLVLLALRLTKVGQDLQLTQRAGALPGLQEQLAQVLVRPQMGGVQRERDAAAPQRMPLYAP